MGRSSGGNELRGVGCPVAPVLVTAKRIFNTASDGETKGWAEP
jgi:hypothetical protein